MKFFFDSIGCKLNQSEIEKMAMQFRSLGHEVVASPVEADYVIVNTCTVTAAASADSRKAIRRAARQGKVKIIATGCYATIDPETIQCLPSVSDIVSNNKKEKIPEIVLGDGQHLPSSPMPRIPLPGNRKRTRAFIKVQDGCDNHCTYCITRIARGKSRSQPVKVIFNDISSALEGGSNEIVLTGVNLGSWGKDLENEGSLSDVIVKILANFDICRLRLSSLEPWDIDDQMIQAFQAPGFCRHLHIPLQSGSDKILKAMGRRNTASEYGELLDKIREAIPEIAITTDIIVGFPGESDVEFHESLQFAMEMDFSGGHVFRYSKRPGTHAENFGSAPTTKVSKERSQLMRDAFESMRAKYQEKFIGDTLSVLWQDAKKTDGKWILYGLSDNYLNVQAESISRMENQFSDVFIKDIRNKSVFGEIVLPKPD
jgi:threonylcarbamoyladenosine tRNA methylthiotransferase MtaB